MATLTLDKLWINRLDGGEGVGVYSSVGKTSDTSVVGDVRMYAGARLRSVTQEGKRKGYNFTVRYATGATARQLEGWIGYAVQVRDVRGQVFVGVFYSVQRTELRDTDRYDLAIVLNGITEGV